MILQPRFLRDRPRLAGMWAAYLTLAVLSCTTPGLAAAQGVDLVRMEGILRAKTPPGTATQLTLAIGTNSVPFSVVSAQRMSGMPATAPEIFSALGPGPPPVRVEGRAEMTKKIVDAPADTRVTIIGNLDPGIPFLTLMEVTVADSAGAK